MRILLVPGGGSSVDGYFTHVERLLAPHARLIRADPPGLDVAAGRRWLTLPEHAGWLARVVQDTDAKPVIVIGHSLGCLVALRLALDEPELVDGLLLLDPGPPIFGALLPRPLLEAIALFPRLSRRHPGVARAVPLHVRIRWFVLGGLGIAADVAAGGLRDIPTVLVSAGEHAQTSMFSRTHAKLVALIPKGRHEIWEGTTHALHPEQPGRVVETALRLEQLVGSA